MRVELLSDGRVDWSSCTVSHLVGNGANMCAPLIDQDRWISLDDGHDLPSSGTR